MKKAVEILKKVGRPKSAESTKSCTVSLTPSQRKKIESKHGSLTKAIKTLLK